MKLAWGEQNFTLTFHENEVVVLTVEKSHTFSSLIQNFYWQCRGDDGELALSENEVLIPLANHVSVVWNPFLADINEKKILNKLHQEMKKISDEECCQSLGDICNVISRYLNEVSMKIPYAISFDEEVDGLAIYKLCNVKLESDEVDMSQKLIEYIRALALLCNIKMVVFINLKAYLDESQLLELYKHAFYYKIKVLLIEDAQKNRMASEKHYILDLDDCLIEI